MAGQLHLIEKPKNGKKPFVLSLRDHHYLQAIFAHRGLTVEQLTRLLYKPGSLTYVRVKAKELVQEKYLSRLHFPTVSPGASPFVYTLGTRGLRYLAEADGDVEGFRPLHAENYFILKHLLAVNDFAISAQLLPRVDADVILTSWLHDWQLQHEPVTAKINNTNVSSVPDLLLDFTVHAGIQKKPFAMPIWVEIDKGTEWGKKFKDKLHAIIQLVTSNAPEKRFGVQSVTVAFATLGTAKRRDLMRQHIKSVLEEMGKLRYADLFLFASLPQELDPKQVFLSPMWYTPTSDTPLSLLDLSD